MSSNKSIIVERGAKLIVNNGGKISSCNGNWKSIFVEGSPSGQNTHLSTMVATKSGVVQLNAGSLIENAQTAISMSASHIPWPNTPSYYGGYVYTNQSTIQNCGKAIEFMTYARNGAKDQSKIINSTINQCINGISIWANDGVTVQGTTMSNITQTGLYSLDAEVIVNDGSIFNNCQIGLLLNNTINYAYGSDIGFSGTSGSTFQNCSTGIRAIAQNTSGTLKIGRNVLYNNSSQGIHIDGIARYFVQNNSITGGNTGVALNASGTSAGNRVEGNTFFSQQAGITYGGNNGSFLIISNCFSNYTLAAINGFSGSNVNVLQSINGSSSASNCFGSSSVPTFLNYGTNVHYLWDPSVQCTQPINAVGLTFGMAGNTQNSCIGSYIMSNQSNTFDEQKFNSILINLKSSINKAQNKADVEILNIQKFHLLQDLIFNKMSVKNPDLESITNKLIEENDFYSHTLLFSSYISQNNLQNASSLLDKMARSDDQIAIDYVYSQRLMVNYLKNPLIYKISNSDKSRLYELCKKGDPMYGFSRAIYYVLTGEFVSNEMEGKALSERTRTQTFFNLLPNPANSWIYIDSNKKLSDIKIFSLNGALVYSISLNVEDIKHSINIESLMNGVYLTKITCLDGEVITDKFIKN